VSFFLPLLGTIRLKLLGFSTDFSSMDFYSLVRLSHVKLEGYSFMLAEKVFPCSQTLMCNDNGWPVFFFLLGRYSQKTWFWHKSVTLVLT